MYGLLQQQRLNAITVIYIDEAVFTFNTFLTKAWSSSYSNISVPEAKINVRAHALVAGVSEEVGLEGYLIVLKAINTESYIEFLRKLKQKYQHRKLALFIDNLMVHKAEGVNKVYAELEMTPIFNVPYSPQFNGIESYFSLLKNEYKKLLLKYLVKEQPFEVTNLIKQSID
jgi:transposase